MAFLSGLKQVKYSLMESIKISARNFNNQRQNIIKVASRSSVEDQPTVAERRTSRSMPRVSVATWVNFRSFHCSARASVEEGSNVLRLKSWPFELETPFGKLLVKDFPFPTRIVPTNPHDYPAGDRVFVHLLASSVSSDMSDAALDPSSFAETISNISCLSNEEQGITISHDGCSGMQPPLALVIEVPTCYDIDVSTKDEGHISVENLENEMCYINTNKGDITLKSMKSANVNVESTSGNISCLKALQGSGVIKTRNNGTVNADRIQGLDFEFSTESGDVHIKDIYTRKSQVCSHTGSVHISNMHTDCKITTGGDVFTGCVQGSMSVSLPGQATFKGYLSCHDDINIETDKGDIEIKLPEECVSHIDLSGHQVDIDSALVFLSTQPSDHQQVIGELNGGGVDANIIAKSKEGSITVKTQSWFDSLELGT
ncbi:protein FAM185A-like [Lytechinus pictus]|uniref:protein FAM185A-like n=1 Tax=Lytechinus pictus TaxID=7653 RepID=UPI0030BA0374